MFRDPEEYSWFPSKKITIIVLIPQRRPYDENYTSSIYNSPFRPFLFPRIQSFEIMTELLLDETCEIFSKKILLRSLTKALTLQKNPEVPVWRLTITCNDPISFPALFFYDSYRDMLRKLILNSEANIWSKLIKKLQFPNLEKLVITKNPALETYKELIRQVHHWPKLEHLTFSFSYKYSENDTISVTGAVDEIVKLPTSLKTCHMILDAPESSVNGLVPITDVIEIEAVTSISDKSYTSINEYKAGSPDISEDFEIMKYLNLPRVRKATQTFNGRQNYTYLVLAKDLGKSLTHMELDVWNNKLFNVIPQLNGFINLRVLIVTISCYPGVTSYEFESTINTILQRICLGGKWSEPELKSMFTYLLENDYKDIFEIKDRRDLNLSSNKTLDVLMKLFTDPMSIEMTGWNYGQELNTIIFLETMLASLPHNFPSLEYLFLNMRFQRLPQSLQFLKLLLAPPSNIKQVLISCYEKEYLDLFPKTAYSGMDLTNKADYDSHNYIFYDLAKKRSLPLISQHTIYPMNCFDDDFNGWV